MFIIPMSSNINTNGINSLSPSSDKSTNASGESSGLGFKEIFQDVVKNVEETEAATKMDAYNLSIGNVDDLHTTIINAAKADVALQTMVQLRNKFLEAHSEIMRINL
ncbi:flagellar hook-basal body complex protein FliE [Anoxybacterium hadale]|uniref:Flagellar hook-basal body complex protein FliE n=1 Tax=Anoxybacterium hadale TaxID=3408580 RepID=A0ACD1ACD5_9FIRM|nr:flagellar hook-basal body complex protein FliE [Clostridiales bacterium]